MVTEKGPPEVLRVLDRPDPRPGPGEVRVAVKAAGINFSDLMARIGLYPDAPPLPAVLGYEFAGEVESLGEGVEGVSAGDRVMGGSRFGGQAELVVTGTANLVPLPEGWSFEEGAALPVNYATAYAGLIRYGALAAGERVLIHAAAGGVGIAATQIAREVGAEIFGTASASKHDLVRGFGVDHPIDYRSQSFVEAVRRVAGEKQPLDLVMDAVGGKSFRQSFSLLRPGGRLICYGASSLVSGEKRNMPRTLAGLAQTPWYNPMRLMPQSKAVIGLNLLTLWDAKGTIDEFVEPLQRWIESGAIRPVVSEAFPLERAPDAHRFILERKNVGKVVLTT